MHFNSNCLWKPHACFIAYVKYYTCLCSHNKTALVKIYNLHILISTVAFFCSSHYVCYSLVVCSDELLGNLAVVLLCNQILANLQLGHCWRCWLKYPISCLFCAVMLYIVFIHRVRFIVFKKSTLWHSDHTLMLHLPEQISPNVDAGQSSYPLDVKIHPQGRLSLLTETRFNSKLRCPSLLTETRLNSKLRHPKPCCFICDCIFH